MGKLAQYLPWRTYGIASAYRGAEIVAMVAGVSIHDDDSLSLDFPAENPFRNGDLLTVHLDNRTGLETFTIELRVYRCSYKGVVVESDSNSARVRPNEYSLRYSNHSVADMKAPDYAYPADPRPLAALEPSPYRAGFVPDPREEGNKLGVWVTRSVDRPHTTVMAFLSSPEDDIFVISHRGTFKSSLIHRDARCLFAMDHRASYHFEKRYEWNYTLVKALARTIDRGEAAFAEIQARFVEKNPWELPFFTDPKVELFHLEPLEIILPLPARQATWAPARQAT